MAQEYTGWDESDEYENENTERKRIADKLIAATTTDCRTEDGITVGLVDSLITIGRILKQRLVMLKSTPAIEEALKDLKNDTDLKFILDHE